MSLHKKVWQTLSAINVNDNTQKKGNLTYLSWAWAWSTLMEYFPESVYGFNDRTLSDGTMEVTCTLIISEGEESVVREMWLPVMDYRNKAIANPDAFQVNTAKMRCLTKCISMMGLGMYIYAGEDLPDQAAEERYKALKAEDELKAYQELCAEHQDSIDAIKMGIVDDDYSSAYEAWRELGEDLQRALWRAPTKGGCFTTEERNIMKTPEFRQA
jgi:hypothetical protein